MSELTGWIQPCMPERNVNECRRELKAIGVDVGEWNAEAGEFQRCVVSNSAMDTLDPLWGEYIWGLARDGVVVVGDVKRDPA